MFKLKPCFRLLVCVCLLGVPAQVFSTQLQASINELMPTEVVYPTALGSQFGLVVSPAGDIDGDGYRDFAIGAPAFEGIHINRLQDKGAVFIIYGNSIQQKAATIDLSQDTDKFTIVTGNQDYPIGTSIDSVKDFNNDGFQDITIGTQNGKAAFIILGKDKLPSIISPDTYESNGIMISNTGKSISSAGDFNGDSFPDVLFGNPISEVIVNEDQSYTYGVFSLLYGGENIPNELNAKVPLKDVLFNDRGNPNTSYSKHVDGGADYNDDGYDDIIITSDEEANIVYGGPNVFSPGKADYGLTLEHTSNYVNTCSDIDADGFEEIIVGLPNNQALLLLGDQKLKGTINLRETPQKWGKLFKGVDRLYSVGDLNGDGFGDIAAALPQANVGKNVMAGQVIFIFGQPEFPDVINIDDIRNGTFNAIDYVIVNGMQAFDVFGMSVAGIGDLQNDGFEDVVIGAPTQSLPGDSMQKQPGKAYVIQGIEFYYALQTHRSSFSQGSQKR